MGRETKGFILGWERGPSSEAWWEWLFLCQVSAVFSAAAKTGMTITEVTALEVCSGDKMAGLRTFKITYVDVWNG